MCNGFINLHEGNFKASHNDIKPENMMIEMKNGQIIRAAIIDFGLSSIMKEFLGRTTQIE